MIVRAFGGEPLERVAIGTQDRGVLICRPDRIEAVERGESEPVCFPSDLVFAASPDLFAALRSAYAAGDKDRLEALWHQAQTLDTKGWPDT